MTTTSLSSPIDICRAMRDAIESALPGAKAAVIPASPGHYEISVTSEVFRDQTRVKQQQVVYAAIAHLMRGDSAPVHAIDRLQTLLPDS